MTDAPRRFSRHEHHGKHSRSLSDRVHPQRQDSLRRRPSDRRDLSDLRCVRRAAAGQQADSPAQAMYHFISGYTAKVAGTEMGVTEPQATFSPCFGGPFLVWHPEQIRRAARGKDAKHKAHVWLVNTGWSGGGYGSRQTRSASKSRARSSTPFTAAAWPRQKPRAIQSSVSRSSLMPRRACGNSCRPRETWADKAAYDATAKKLAALFNKNFETYAAGASAEVKAAAPVSVRQELALRALQKTNRRFRRERISGELCRDLFLPLN